MQDFLKLIKEYKTTKKKKAYLLILIEKSRNIQFPTYSLIQLLNSINHKPHKIISSEGWIEQDYDLQQQRKSIEKEKAELRKAKSEFEKNKKDNQYLKGSILVISAVVIGLFVFFYIIPNFKSKGEEEMWRNALIENTMASYNSFMRQYPQSKYYEKAIEKNKMIKANLKNNSYLIDSTNILANKFKNRKTSTNYSGKKKEETDKNKKEEKDPGIDYQKALNYYYTAREKFSLKDFKTALTYIDLALLYDPENDQYIKFKSKAGKSLTTQEDKLAYKKTEENVRKKRNNELSKKTKVKATYTPETKIVEKAKSKNTAEEDKFKENVSFTVVEVVPVYPGCKGSNAEKKKCMERKITKHFNKRYKTGFARDLGLSPGKKRIFVQFTIDKTGKVIRIKAKGPHIGLENEAVRVAHLLPNMIPGRQQGRIVNVKYTLPITVIVK